MTVASMLVAILKAWNLPQVFVEPQLKEDEAEDETDDDNDEKEMNNAGKII